jgi:hypothetical protein
MPPTPKTMASKWRSLIGDAGYAEGMREFESRGPANRLRKLPGLARTRQLRSRFAFRLCRLSGAGNGAARRIVGKGTS